MRRVLRGLSLVLVVAVAIVVARGMWNVAIPSGRYMDFDPAAHGVHGVKMAQAIREHDPRWFLALIEERVVWPPLLPMIETPAFLLFGNAMNVAEALMIGLYALTIVLAYVAGRAFGGPTGVLVGSLTAALVAASPFFQLFSVQIMAEMPGALLLFATVATYVRWRRHRRTAALVGTCLGTTLLFFLKYNYALLWVVPLALNELGHALPAPRALLDSLRRLRPTPYRVAVALAVVAVAGLWLARRAGWAPGGQRLGLRLPLAAFAAVVALPPLMRPRASFRSVRDAMRAWTPGARWFFWLTAVPCVLWLIVPTHLKGFLHFVVNRRGQVPLFSLRSLTIYPESFLADYSPAPWIGAIVLGLAALAAWRGRRWPAERRIVPLAMCVGFAMCVAHRFKSPRFFFTVPPLIWLAAALAVALGLAVLFERRAAAGAFERVAPALGCAALALALAFGFRPEVARERFERVTMPESLGRVLDAIADENVASRGTMLFGIWNRLSPGLTEWNQLLRHPHARGPQRPMNPQWYPAATAAALEDSVADDPRVERVLVLDLPHDAPLWAPAFEEENPWIHEVRARLFEDPRFVHERRTTFAETGYALDVFRRVR